MVTTIFIPLAKEYCFKYVSNLVVLNNDNFLNQFYLAVVMSVITIVLFFVYCYGLGFTVSSFVKNSDNFLERNLMRLGFGLSLLPFLALVLNRVNIPADWKIILALSLVYPLYYMYRNYKKFKFSFRLTKANLSIFIMLIIFFVNFYIYGSGAFNYPYLENDDSWSHAMGVKYISIEKTAFVDGDSPFHYIDPYPPTYDLLLGILHQTNDSVYFTLKFFNALIISLSTIFFYFFVKEFTQNRNKALFAAFALFSIPAFMSHFIWAISIAVPLYFVVFYALERMKHDPRWWIVAAFSMVTVLTATPTHSTYFGLFFVLYVLTKIILERRLLLRHIAAGTLGLSLSFLFWWLPMIQKYGLIGTIQGVGFNIGYVKEFGLGTALRGTGDRVYTFSDFFFAQKQNMINNPIGIGIFLSILTIVAVIFLFLKYKSLLKKENQWMVITLVLFVFTLYAVNASRFTIKLSPFRAWMLLAIPICILAAEGTFNMLNLSRKLSGKPGMYVVLLILLTGICFTSTQQKIAVNTATWPPGAFWSSGEEIGAYVWIKDNLPKNSHMFTFVNNGPVIGMDMYTCHWCSDVKDYQKEGFNQSAEENHNWLKSKGYDYLIIDGQTAQKFGADESNKKLQELGESGLFELIFQSQGAVLLKI
jgi:hypothetical protein